MQRLQCIRILGVDPGSRLTGYGCVDVVGNQIRHVTNGVLKLSSTSGRNQVPLEQRLLSLHEGLSKVISECRPSILAVEKVFFAKNALSALKLGQARGVVVLAGAIHSLEVVEYSPNEIKAAVTGHGQADKEQVAKMVRLLTGCGDFATFATNDASDALALAFCHAQRVMTLAALGDRPRSACNEILKQYSRSRSKGRRMSLAEAVGVTPEMAAGRKRMKARGSGDKK